MADLSIYRNLLAPVRSPDEVAAGYMQAEGQRMNLLAARQQMAQQQEAQARRNGLQQYLSSGVKGEDLERGLLERGYVDESLRFAKDRRENQKVDAETAASTALADQRKVDTQRKLYEVGVQMMQGAPDVQSAVTILQQGVGKGAWGMQEAQASIAALQKAVQSGDQRALVDWKQNQLKTILAPKELMPTIQTRNTGGSTDTLAVDPFGQGARMVSSVKNTASPGDVMSNQLGLARLAEDKRAHNMADSRSREATAASMTKPFEVTGPDGPMLVQQDKQGNIRPVHGYTPKSANLKAPAEFSKAMTGVNELNRALDSYEQALKEAGGPSAIATGTNRAKLQGAYTSLKMGLKNAFELGALTGPDVGVLEGMLVDPTSPKMLLIGGKGVGEQIAQTRSYLKNREGALESTYQRPNPAKQQQPAAPAGWKIEEVK
jgi:hypothetical protein